MKTKNTKTSKACLGAGDNAKWFKSSRTRNKNVVVTFERTPNGYVPLNASIIQKQNQFTTKSFPVDVDMVVGDIAQKGIINH
jgi:hypothetical protein